MAEKGTKDENYSETIVLEFDDGTVVETENMGIFEVDGKEYIALIPDDGSDDVYIYGHADIGEDEYDPELREIEDDEEFERVVKEFDALMDGYEED